MSEKGQVRALVSFAGLGKHVFMKTILIVDDEPKMVRVLKGYLEQAGFRAVTAEDGQMGLTTFRHEA